jgi:hypothetical protein
MENTRDLLFTISGIASKERIDIWGHTMQAYHELPGAGEDHEKPDTGYSLCELHQITIVYFSTVILLKLPTVQLGAPGTSTIFKVPGSILQNEPPVRT